MCWIESWSQLANPSLGIGSIHVFAQTNPFRSQDPQYGNSLVIPLPNTSSDTRVLVHAALFGVKRIYPTTKPPGEVAFWDWRENGSSRFPSRTSARGRLRTCSSIPGLWPLSLDTTDWMSIPRRAVASPARADCPIPSFARRDRFNVCRLAFRLPA